MSETTYVGWRLLRVLSDGEERFLIEFVNTAPQRSSSETWSCDRVARSEADAREYALRHGISPGNFGEALERARGSS